MWNGTGHPAVAGDDIPLATRLMHVASTGALFTLHAGEAEAVAQVRRRSGTYLDPELAEVFADRANELVGDLAELDGYEAALAWDPHPVSMVDEDRVEAVARTFGSLADLKSPWLQGHSAAVAELAATAVGALGLVDQVRRVRVAGFLHDVGRVGVSSRIWDKPGALTATERDQARLHPYYSERTLARTPALADVARLVGQHHERCDGSGYHRGLAAAQLTLSSRVLAAADEYRSLVEERPHRTALSATEAAGRLRADKRRGPPGHGCRGCGPRGGRHPGGGPPDAPRGPHGASGGGAADGGTRDVQPADRPTARDLGPHCGAPRPGHLREDRCLHARQRRPVRHAARTARRTLGRSTHDRRSRTSRAWPHDHDQRLHRPDHRPPVRPAAHRDLRPAHRG